MPTKRTTIALALVLGTTAGTSPSLMADPPGISEAEMEAHLAQYREEMTRIHERKRLGQRQMEARLRSKRLHRERQAAIRELVARTDAHTLTPRAELGPFELDPTATLEGTSLGMMQSQPEGDTKAAVPAGGRADLAGQATNPIASLWQIQIQNTVVGESFGADGVANQFAVQPVMPWKLGGVQQITRVTVPLVWTPDFDGPIDSTRGLGDTSILSLSVFDVGDGGQLAIGPSLVIPTASSDLTGQGKWQAGPAILYFNTPSKSFQWGILAYQNWSFASTGGDEDRPEVSTLFLQPILVYHFGKGWYLSTPDIPATIDWNNGGEVSWPLGAKLGAIGEIGGQKVNAFIEPFYTLGKPDSGNEWGIKFGLSLLFPTK